VASRARRSLLFPVGVAGATWPCASPPARHGCQQPLLLGRGPPVVGQNRSLARSARAGLPSKVSRCRRVSLSSRSAASRFVLPVPSSRFAVCRRGRLGPPAASARALRAPVQGRQQLGCGLPGVSGRPPGPFGLWLSRSWSWSWRLQLAGQGPLGPPPSSALRAALALAGAPAKTGRSCFELAAPARSPRPAAATQALAKFEPAPFRRSVFGLVVGGAAPEVSWPLRWLQRCRGHRAAALQQFAIRVSAQRGPVRVGRWPGSKTRVSAKDVAEHVGVDAAQSGSLQRARPPVRHSHQAAAAARPPSRAASSVRFLPPLEAAAAATRICERREGEPAAAGLESSIAWAADPVVIDHHAGQPAAGGHLKGPAASRSPLPPAGPTGPCRPPKARLPAAPARRPVAALPARLRGRLSIRAIPAPGPTCSCLQRVRALLQGQRLRRGSWALAACSCSSSCLRPAPPTPTPAAVVESC